MNICDMEIFPDNVIDLIHSQEYIGIRMSGGIDSAILCYIVLTYFPEVKLLPITMYNKLRPAAETSVKNVINELKRLVPGNKLMDSEIGYFDTTGYTKKVDQDTGVATKNPKDVFQRPYIRSLFDKHNNKLNFILSGETLNPPLEVQTWLRMQDSFMKSRNHMIEDILYLYTYDDIQKYEYRPFRNYTKKQISGIAKQLSLIETLFPYTETCETEPHKYTDMLKKVHGMTYENPGVEPCQCCWPCREKYWAYGVFDFNTPKRVEF